MIDKLKIKAIYDDFVVKVQLSDEEKEVLDLLIKKKSIVEISLETNMCERNVSKIISKLKHNYSNYKEFETLKIKILTS